MSQNKKLIQSILRAYSRSPRTPPWQVFFRPAALKNLVIHQVFLRFFALQGEKIPTNSVHLEILNRLLAVVRIKISFLSTFARCLGILDLRTGSVGTTSSLPKTMWKRSSIFSRREIKQNLTR